MAQKITQAIIYQEIVSMKEKLLEHTQADSDNFREIKQLLEGTESSPGMKIRIDRLEQKESARKMHFGYVWSAIAALLAGLAVNWLS